MFDYRNRPPAHDPGREEWFLFLLFLASLAIAVAAIVMV